jgi:hypothetical protein
MPYTDRFTSTDNLIPHLSGVITLITDPSLIANYTGFLSVSAVTVFELAIKDIFELFARNKNNTFGNYVQVHLERINGRIKLDDLKKDHIKRFGDKYLIRFKRELDKKEAAIFTTSHQSIKACYSNLIVCRHEYVHKGNPTLSFSEVVNNYHFAKEVIHTLNFSLRR